MRSMTIWVEAPTIGFEGDRIHSLAYDGGEACDVRLERGRCRLWPHHDGEHMPFAEELIAEMGIRAVAPVGAE